MSGRSTHNTQEVVAGARVGNLTPELQEALQEAKARLQEIYGDRLRRFVLYDPQARADARFAESERLQAALAKPGSADGVEGTLRTLKEMTPPLVAN